MIEDVALKVVNGDGVLSFFVGKFFNTDRHLNFSDGLPSPKYEAFSGFGLNGDESILKQIGFSQKEGDPPFVYKVGHCNAEILLFDAKENRWVKSGEFGFFVEQDDLNQLEKMQTSPRSNGGVFVNMVLQNKRTTESLNRVNGLK